MKKLKELQRNAAIQARERLTPEERSRHSRAIAEKLLSHAAYKAAGTIFSFRPFRKEVDADIVNSLAERAGKTVAYPICREGGIMDAAVPEGEAAWTVDSFGIKTPIKGRARIVPPEEIDLVIAPCVAFDPSTMMRIGWGAGYYDRFLPKCVNAYKIAIAFSVQRVDGLCFDPVWDVPLDAILTETAEFPNATKQME